MSGSSEGSLSLSLCEVIWEGIRECKTLWRRLVVGHCNSELKVSPFEFMSKIRPTGHVCCVIVIVSVMELARFRV